MKKVLIVESEEEQALITAAAVNALGFEPIILQPGQLLAVVFIELNPDIVIIYRKFFIKNRQLFIEGEDRLSDAYLIITSGAFLTPERVRELGADRYLRKPFQAEDVEAAITEYKVKYSSGVN